MKSKRGLSYVDWVISLGTFLIAVIFIFILIRPQLEPKSEKQNLMQIIEDGFYSETEWSVREIPLFITLLKDKYVVNGITKSASIKINYSPDFKYDITASPHLSVSPGNPITIQCSSGTCSDKNLTLTFYPIDPKDKNLPDVGLACNPSNTAICDAVLGATTTTTGINENQLSSLSTNGYTKTKNNFKYPSLNEFAIFIDGSSIFPAQDIPQQTNVFVKERKYWKLSKNNVRTQISIRFQVW